MAAKKVMVGSVRVRAVGLTDVRMEGSEWVCRPFQLVHCTSTTRSLRIHICHVTCTSEWNLVSKVSIYIVWLITTLKNAISIYRKVSIYRVWLITTLRNAIYIYLLQL